MTAWAAWIPLHTRAPPYVRAAAPAADMHRGAPPLGRPNARDAPNAFEDSLRFQIAGRYKNKEN